MDGLEYVDQAVGIALAVVVAALLLGQLLGQPILLGYVASGSMAPELATGDGFVAVPDGFSGEITEGDVIVFEAREVNEGELTTHRVVDVTDEGYVTKGDANPFTDQDAGEPPVTDGQIVATTLQLGGEIVTIPYLGTVAMRIGAAADALAATVSGIGGGPSGGTGDASSPGGAGVLLVGIGVALAGFGFLIDRAGPSRRETRRSYARENVLSVWTAIGIVLLVLVTLATAAMVIPSGTTAYDVVSTDRPTEDPQVLAPGETGRLTRVVDNAGWLPVVVRAEAASAAVEVEPATLTVGAGAQEATTVELTAPADEGRYLGTVSEYRYLLVAPPGLLLALHDVHPYLAVAAVDAVVVGATIALVLIVFGSGDLRLRRPGGHVPTARRVHRRVRRWID